MMDDQTLHRLLKTENRRKSLLEYARLEVEELLKKARRARDHRAQIKWHMRLAYIERKMKRLEALAHIADLRKVYISYSKQRGERFFKAVRDRLIEENYTVSENVGETESVNTVARDNAFQNTAVFVAILTEDRPLSQSGFAPSDGVWSDVKSAIRMRKPMIVIVQRGIADVYMNLMEERTVPVFTFVSDNDYLQVITLAINEIKEQSKIFVAQQLQSGY